MKKVYVIVTLVICLTAWFLYQFIFNSVSTINRSKKGWEWVENEQSTLANDFFWEQFHLGKYDSITVILEHLTKAYLANPNDLQTVYHLGFTHFWALSEHQFLDPIPSNIIDHAVLAQKYLGEAYKMNPDDARLLSFLAAAKMSVGALSQDQSLLKEGYLNGLKSIRDWKDFGEFSLAYSMSRLPHTDPNFQKALKWMEKTMNRCYCENVELKYDDCVLSISKLRENPNVNDRKRIVPNSWVAPHNVEGFFMFYGDLLVKSGDWKKGEKIYALAKYSPDYQNWPYQQMLETRIFNAEKNVQKFRNERVQGENVAPDEAIMVQTSVSCRACHQMSPKEIDTKYQNFNRKASLNQKYYFLQ